MRVAGMVGGVIVGLVGIVWTLQGVGSEFAPQSFMTGSGTWVVIGLITFAAGTALAVWSWRRDP